MREYDDWKDVNLASCPLPERIWEAACGRLTPAEMGEIIDHAVDCSSCAHDLRAARRIGVEIGEIKSGLFERVLAMTTAAISAFLARLRGVRKSVWQRGGMVVPGGTVVVLGTPLAVVAGTGTAVAASVIIVLLVAAQGGPSVAPALSHPRDAAGPIVELLVPDGSLLRRDHFELCWQAPPEARYEVRVLTLDLDEVVVATDLEEPVFRVDAHLLAGIASGTQLLWQVDAFLPDGERIPSGTREVRLE